MQAEVLSVLRMVYNFVVYPRRFEYYAMTLVPI